MLGRGLQDTPAGSADGESGSPDTQNALKRKHEGSPRLIPQIFDADYIPEDDANSTMESINSANYRYRYEHGRRYHGFTESAYLLPNDEREQERLEGQHQMWLMALEGKLYLAPLRDDIKNVLDVATGTGNWAMDFADEFPNAQVIGTDLSPIQPKYVPPNCSFIVENSEDEWIWNDKFDYIHSRTISSNWRDWDSYIHRCFQYLEPGGYVELQDFTFPFECDDATASPSTSPMMQWSAYFASAAASSNVDMSTPERLAPLLESAGFVDIQVRRLRLPLGGWSDNENERVYGDFYGGIFDWAVSLALFVERLGWTRVRAEVFLVEVRREALDRGVHVYIPLYVYTARKPENLA